MIRGLWELILCGPPSREDQDIHTTFLLQLSTGDLTAVELKFQAGNK